MAFALATTRDPHADAAAPASAVVFLARSEGAVEERKRSARVRALKKINKIISNCLRVFIWAVTARGQPPAARLLLVLRGARGARVLPRRVPARVLFPACVEIKCRAPHAIDATLSP